MSSYAVISSNKCVVIGGTSGPAEAVAVFLEKWQPDADNIKVMKVWGFADAGEENGKDESSGQEGEGLIKR